MSAEKFASDYTYSFLGPVRPGIQRATHGNPIPSSKTTHGISGDQRSSGSRAQFKNTFFNEGGNFRRTGGSRNSETHRGFAPTRINSQHNVAVPVQVTHAAVVPSHIHHTSHNAAPAQESHHATHAAAPAQVETHHASHNAVPAPAHHASHNAPVTHTVAAVPAIQHHAVHNAVQHHGSHGDSYGHDEYEQPDPFHFEYGVHDDHYYTDFRESREGDGYGNIHGEYEVSLPDGRIQYVHYSADGNYGGTIMDVEYKGEARHPESYGGYHGGHHAEHGAAPAPSHHE